MNHQNHQFKIGIFVVFGLILILGSIFFLGADKSIFSSYAKIHTQFQNVQGLYNGSVVTLSGVNIGNIEKISFIPEVNKLNVQMKIETKFLYRVTEGTRAEINTQGALGDKFINLIPGDAMGPAHKDGDRIEALEGGGILDVLANRGKDTTKVFDIIDDVHKMTNSLKTENKLAQIVENLRSTSANLNEASAEMKKFTNTVIDDDSQRKFKASILHLESVLGKLDRGDGTLGALINDPALHERLKSLLGADQRKNHVKSLLRSSIEQAPAAPSK